MRWRRLIALGSPAPPPASFCTYREHGGEDGLGMGPRARDSLGAAGVGVLPCDLEGRLATVHGLKSTTFRPGPENFWQTSRLAGLFRDYCQVQFQRQPTPWITH